MDPEYLEEVLQADNLEEIIERVLAESKLSLVFALGDAFYTLDSLLGFAERKRRIVLLVSRPGLNRALRELAKGRYVVVKKEMKAATYRSVLLYLNDTGRIRLTFSLDKLAKFPAVSVAPLAPR